MCSFGPSDLIGNDFRVAVFPFETQSGSLLVIYERRVFHLLQRVAQVLRIFLLFFSLNLLLLVRVRSPRLRPIDLLGPAGTTTQLFGGAPLLARPPVTFTPGRARSLCLFPLL